MPRILTLIAIIFLPLSLLTGCQQTSAGIFGHNQLSCLTRQGVQIISINNQLTLRIPSDNLFFNSTAEIQPKQRPILASIARHLVHYAVNGITVSGHTDRVWTKHPARKLSMAQAQAVASFIWHEGYNPDRIHIVGKGAKHRLNNQNNSDAAAQNRYVQISAYIG